LALSQGNHVSHIQLVTWNDLGEGTMLEPTEELGYSLLAEVQAFTKVNYDVADLQLIEKLYRFRKQHSEDELIQLKLDQVYYYLVSLLIERARDLLSTIEE